MVEHAHHLGGPGNPAAAGPVGPALLGVLLDPLLEEDRACIVVSDEALPAGALPARGATVTADDLRLGPGAAGELLGREAPRLPAAAARRVASLCRGATADLVGVCGAAAALGPAVVAQAADQAGGVEDLLANLAAGLLAGTGADGHRALALALEVGYSHPALSAAVLGQAAAPPAGPWLQPLADGWSTLRTGWRDPLRAALAPARPLAPRRSTGRPTTWSTGAPPNAPSRSTWSRRTPTAPPGPRRPGRTLARRTTTAAGGAGRPPAQIHLLGQLWSAWTPWLWTTGRAAVAARARHLVTHRDPWPRREQLMEAFWPEAAPAAARNSLNVAVHGLRRAFRDSAGIQVVVLEDGSYRLGPGLRLWLDTDEFELHVAGGRRLEAAGDLAGAAAEYERALALYQGDFLADDPYEDWPVLTREHLLLGHLDVLDRLSGLYFGQHQYGACVALCRLLVERDRCREDAHRRLMRCFTRQGQPHLALRQYQACADALDQDLGVGPDPATVALAQQIRWHQPV